MLSASITKDKRTLDRLKPRRGSLPLKKRRVTLYETTSEGPKGTFVPLKPQSRKILCEELKSVTPEPSTSVAGVADAAMVGCLSLTATGFCNKPCFKQSNYCKLHFLQREGSSSSLGGVCSTGDKRFTGAEGQIRCSATTTRGRACAYVAVLGQPQKYCHLHADYDTNPSPRRDAKRDSVSTLTSSLSFQSSSSLTISRASPTSSDISLLSSIPTDKWKHQSVRIALGPLTGRIGVVEKWGNGWVSCSVEGVGFHNRRAFELQLITGTQHQPALSPPPMTPTTTTKPAAIKQVTPCSVADVSAIQVPEIRLRSDDSSKSLSFRLSERSVEAFRNPL